MKIQVRNIENEEYFLQNGVFEHACKAIPPKNGKVACDVCGITIVDDFDYSDEVRERDDN
jgi:hypothetical protein